MKRIADSTGITVPGSTSGPIKGDEDLKTGDSLISSQESMQGNTITGLIQKG